MVHKYGAVPKEGAAGSSGWLPALDDASPVPLYEQLIEQVALGVAGGRLAPGDPLPSVRDLAARVRVNPNTAARSLRELDRLGLARTIRGVGSVVGDDADPAAREIVERVLARALDRAVDIGRKVGLGPGELSARLAERWSELKEEVAG